MILFTLEPQGTTLFALSSCISAVLTCHIPVLQSANWARQAKAVSRISIAPKMIDSGILCCVFKLLTIG